MPIVSKASEGPLSCLDVYWVYGASHLFVKSNQHMLGDVVNIEWTTLTLYTNFRLGKCLKIPVSMCIP